MITRTSGLARPYGSILKKRSANDSMAVFSARVSDGLSP